MTNVLFIRDLIYRLKMDFGHRMDLYITQQSRIDFGTGIQSVSKKKYRIDRVVLLSEILQRKSIHDIPFLTAGRTFGYGGEFDEGKRTIILSKEDVPKGAKLTNTCYFVYQNESYDVHSVEELEHGCGFIITLKRVDTRNSYQILDVSAQSSLAFGGTCTAEI